MKKRLLCGVRCVWRCVLLWPVTQVWIWVNAMLNTMLKSWRSWLLMSTTTMMKLLLLNN